MGFEKMLWRCGRAALLSMLACAPGWAGVCRVTPAGSAFNDGSSWAVPVSLQQALTASGICTEIWVKKGVYKPTGATNETSFGIAGGVAVYGGFAGSESGRDQRDPAANLTVLSGDIDNNDTVDSNGVDVDASHIVGANSEHVVTISQTNSSTVLDGFTVTGGGAANTFTGGGLQCFCSSRLSRLVFSGNSSAYEGGAIYIENGSPELSDIVFKGNQADNRGGAVSIAIPSQAGNTIQLSESAFSNNQAISGGALSVSTGASTTLRLANVTFNDNQAHGGGAMYISSPADQSVTTLTNVTFSGNQATSGSGGAIYSDSAPGNEFVLRNTILWGDLAPLGQGPEIAYKNGTAVATIKYSIVKGSGGSGSWNGLLGFNGGGNLDVDPQLGALATDRRGTQTMVPAGGSPAIDAGEDTDCPSYDQRGILRPQGAACDIGAVETFVVDLIGHKGMEACWSKAVTEPAFLGLVGSNVEGNTACIPPFVFNFFNGSTFVTYSVCYTAACPGGNVGCPITTHGGAFSDGGDFGAGKFTATGTADNFTLAGVSGFGTCNYSASGITTSYASDYVFTDDGNHGGYAALLNQFTAAPTNMGLGGSGSDPNCGASVAYLYPYFYAYATLGMSVGLKQKLQNPTVGQSVCPVAQ